MFVQPATDCILSVWLLIYWKLRQYPVCTPRCKYVRHLASGGENLCQQLCMSREWPAIVRPTAFMKISAHIMKCTPYSLKSLVRKKMKQFAGLNENERRRQLQLNLILHNSFLLPKQKNIVCLFDGKNTPFKLSRIISATNFHGRIRGKMGSKKA